MINDFTYRSKQTPRFRSDVCEDNILWLKLINEKMIYSVMQRRKDKKV